MRKALFIALLAACGGELDGSYGGDGAGGWDTGGQQDIGAARDAIAQGQVPTAAWITPEGLLSEHDVETVGPPCDAPMCLRPATGMAMSLATGKRERWLHLGMTTGINLSTWQRPPIDLVIAIDKSSSMTIDMEQTTEAAARLVEQLGENDRVAVLAFDDSTHVIHDFAPMANHEAVADSIRDLEANGSFDITEAIETSYEKLAEPSPGRLRRVVVLSCGYPSISTDGSDPTSQLISTHGSEGIGLTFVGVLLGWDPNLANLLGSSHGANYYYLGDLERVETVFDQDVDFVLTPIAYDLSLQVDLAPGWKIERMFGIPGDGGDEAGYEVATAFFSNRRGSLVARLTPDPEGGLSAGTTSLSYRPEPALGWGEPQAQVSDIVYDETAGAIGVRRAAFLVNQAEQMATGCTQWAAGDRDGARATISALLAYMQAERPSLDAAVDGEILLVEKLLANMQ